MKYSIGNELKVVKCRCNGDVVHCPYYHLVGEVVELLPDTPWPYRLEFAAKNDEQAWFSEDEVSNDPL